MYLCEKEYRYELWFYINSPAVSEDAINVAVAFSTSYGS